MLEAGILFRGFPVLMASSLEHFHRHIQICIFCSVIQYIVFNKLPVGSAHEVSTDSSEIIFDEAHFIVKLESFLQPLVLPRHTFPQSESSGPHSCRQNNFQNCSPVLNHSQVNHKSSIIQA